jgi:hydrogenase-4 component F
MELILILLTFIIASIICFAVKNRRLIEFISIFAAALSLIETIIVAINVATNGTYEAYQLFSVDALGAVLMLIIAVVGFAAAIYSVAYLQEETTKKFVGFTRVKEFFVLLNLFLAVMFLAVVSSNPIITWLSIEATTLSTAFLISFYNKPSSMEAAWKYLIINSVGLLLAFFGTLLYLTSLHATGEAGFVTWNNLVANASHLDPSIAKIAFVFILIGYGTKIGLAPMHTWLPDAHSKAPAPISALLSGVLLNVAFVTMLRFKFITDISIGSDFTQKLLIAFGVLSILIASFIIFSQKNYKRMLAYSSIENMGIMAIGFGFGGMGVFAAILHMIYHALIKSALFFSAGNIFLKYGSTKIANIRGVIQSIPTTGAMFILGFFAITGTPPFGVFLTKMLVLSAGVQNHLTITIIVIGLMALLFIGFFRHVSTIAFGQKPTHLSIGENNVWLLISPLALIAAAFCLSFYLPPVLHTLLNSAASPR